MSNTQWKDNLGVSMNLRNENDKDRVVTTIECISGIRWGPHDLKSSNMVKIWEDFKRAENI